MLNYWSQKCHNPFPRPLFGRGSCIKETRSVTLNIFRKKKMFFFKSCVKIELSYVFTINMFSSAAAWNSELSNKTGNFSLVRNYLRPSNNS